MKSSGKRKAKSIELPTENNAATGFKRSTTNGSSTKFDMGTQLLEKTTKSSVINLHPPAKIKLQLFPVDEGTRIGLEMDGHHPYLELTLSARKKISSVLKHLNRKWGSSCIASGEPVLFPYNVCLDNVASQRTWTLNDKDISAGDVYAALGSPAIFRLRYGWHSNHESKSFGVFAMPAPFEACSETEEAPEGCRTHTEFIYEKEKQIAVKNQLNKVTEDPNALAAEKNFLDVPDDELRMDDSLRQSPVQWDDSLTNISIGGLLSEASLQGMFNNSDPKSNGSNLGLQTTQVIADSFDAFIACQLNHPQGPRPVSHDSHSSILDAEETCHAFSFQKLSSSRKDALEEDNSDPKNNQTILKGLRMNLYRMFNNSDPKSNGSNLGLQTTQVIADSFDAFIASQLNHPQGPRPVSHDSHSSVLDAEETCHAFSFQKLSSSRKDALALDATANPRAGILDAAHKSYGFPNAAEIEAGVLQDDVQVEAKTDLSLCSQVYTDESSLGLRGIKWTDSLGPFDLGLSSSGRFVGGESITISSYVN